MRPSEAARARSCCLFPLAVVPLHAPAHAVSGRKTDGFIETAQSVFEKEAIWLFCVCIATYNARLAAFDGPDEAAASMPAFLAGECLCRRGMPREFLRWFMTLDVCIIACAAFDLCRPLARRSPRDGEAGARPSRAKASEKRISVLGSQGTE